MTNVTLYELLGITKERVMRSPKKEMESKHQGRARMDTFKVASLIFHGMGEGVYDSQGSLHNSIQKGLRAL